MNSFDYFIMSVLNRMSIVGVVGGVGGVVSWVNLARGFVGHFCFVG